MLQATLGFAEKVRKSRFGRFFFGKALKELPPAQTELTDNTKSEPINNKER